MCAGETSGRWKVTAPFEDPAFTNDPDDVNDLLERKEQGEVHESVEIIDTETGEEVTELVENGGAEK